MAIQFNPIRLKNGRRPDSGRVKQLMMWGKIFDRLGMAPYISKKGSAGNMGFRTPYGMCVTSSGSFLGALDHDSIITVANVSERKGGVSVYFYGKPKRLPTSEALIYWDIFKKRPDVNVVLHGHDYLCLEETIKVKRKFSNDVAVTSAATDSGSPRFRTQMQTIASGKKNYLVGKGHGFFALGKNFEDAGLLALKFRTEALNLFFGKRFLDRIIKKYDLEQ